MKRLEQILIIIVLLLTLAACTVGEDTSGNSEGEAETVGVEEAGVTMLALVTEIGDRLTVEVLESAYTSGIHWVLLSEDTVYIGKDGKIRDLSCIKVGDTVEILYNGQVMMSYPAQIVARRITVVK